MEKKLARGLFIFRRDFRLTDNTALIRACEMCNQVLPIFIFDPRQIMPQPYRGDHAVQFMLGSLIELEEELLTYRGQLHYFWGEAHEVVEALLAREEIDAVFFNRDYTPFSRNRDRAIHLACERMGRKAFQFDDTLLHEPEALKSGKGTPYTVYTPFYRAASKLPVRNSVEFREGSFFEAELPYSREELFERISIENNRELFRKGGRKEAKEILAALEGFSRYEELRNIPAAEGTTGLSPHLKFGTISAREVYAVIKDLFGEEHSLIKELYWRDFFTQIGFHFPHVFRGAFHSHYDAIEWENNEEFFERWCEGQTGFPLVDAGMRQLNTSGFMHNRVRMVVASFLVKDLLIDWRWGERYFAQKLVDYDPAVNNGNWQWASSTGCDAQPYFRIFNPWLQQKKFDEECRYIKHWVPELEPISSAVIHKLGENFPEGIRYPHPIVDHAERKNLTERVFSEAAARRHSISSNS